MKFGQLIEYNKINIFFKNRARETGFRPSFLKKRKASFVVKASGLQLSFNVF